MVKNRSERVNTVNCLVFMGKIVMGGSAGYKEKMSLWDNLEVMRTENGGDA